MIAAAIDYSNKDVLENYLKELCKEIAIILKQQRGNIKRTLTNDENWTIKIKILFNLHELLLNPLF